MSNDVVSFEVFPSVDSRAPLMSSLVEEGPPQEPTPDTPILDRSKMTPETQFFDDVGKGFDSTTDEIKTLLFEGELFTQNAASPDSKIPVQLIYSLSENQHSYSEITSVVAGAKGRFKLISGGAKYSKESSIITNSYALHISAFVRRVDNEIRLNSRSLSFNRDALEFLNAKPSPEEILTQFGDRVVTGLTTGNELLIDVRITAKSRTEREKISASLRANYAALASGSAKFSSVINQMQSQFTVDVRHTGYNGTVAWADLDGSEVETMINNVLKDRTGSGIIFSYITKDIGDFLIGGRPLKFVSYPALEERLRAALVFEENMEYLAQAAADADYVIKNSDQFEPAVVEQAAKDSDSVNDSMDEIYSIFSEAVGEFKGTGRNGYGFKELMAFREPQVNIYAQKEPAPTPPPAPRKKRRRPWWKL